MDGHKQSETRYRASQTLTRGREGFALAPILYMLALIGIGAGILFSGYSQILRSNAEVTNDLTVKNDLNAASTTLSATSVLGSSDNTVLCPPQGGGATANCSAAPTKMETFATAAASSDASRLPGSYSSAGTSNSSTGFEAGVFAPASGIKQFDAYGHFYIYCRWEQHTNDGTDPAIMVISAGPDGKLDTTCSDTAAKNDDSMVMLTAPTAVNRSAVWQTTTGGNGTQAQFGQVGTQLIVDALGNLTVPGTESVTGAATFGSTGTFAGDVTAPNFHGNVSGTNGTFSGNVSIGGTLSVAGTSTLAGVSATDGNFSGTLGVTGATTLSSTLTAGATTLNSLGVTNDTALSGNLAVTGNSTLGGSLSAGATTLASAGITGNETVGGTLGVTGATTLSSTLTAGDTTLASAAITGNTTIGGTLGLTGSLTGAADATWANGTVTAKQFVGPLTGNVNGTSTNVTGVVQIANGGTGASDAPTARTNLGTNVADNLTAGSIPTGRYATNTIPGAAIENNTVTGTQLDYTGVSAGAYNWGTVDANGRVTYATNVVTNTLTDGSGDSITATNSGGNGLLSFNTNNTTQMVLDNNGYLGIGTTTPHQRLDIVGNERIEGAAGTSREIQFTTGATSERWVISTNGTAESGSNAGSDFMVKSYSDAGAYLDTPFSIDRATSAANFTGTVTASTFYGSGAGLTNIPASSITGTITANVAIGSSNASPNPAISGHATSGFYTPDGANQVAVEGNGVESMQWNTLASGTDYFSVTPGKSGTNPTLAAAGTDTDVSMTLQTQGAGNVIIPNGKVGIGTTSPSTALHIRTGSTNPTIELEGYSSSNVVTSPTILFHNYSGNGNFDLAEFSTEGVSSNVTGLDIYVYNNSQSSLLKAAQFDGNGDLTFDPGGVAWSGTNGSGIIFDGADANGYRKITIGQQGASGYAGMDLKISAGTPYSTASGTQNKGGSVYLYGGAPNSGGTYGNIILADDGTNAIGLVGIGTTSPLVSLDLSHETDALALPVGTSLQRPSLALNGMMRYNSTNGKFEAYQQNTWQDILTTAAGGSTIYIGTSLSAANPQIQGHANSGFYTPDGTSTTAVVANGVEVEQWNTAASGVNYLSVTPGATGTGPTLAAAGSDANVSLILSPKGTGSTVFYQNGGNQFVVSSAASAAANYLAVTGAATGSNPTLAATGSDTNVSLILSPKGTGGVGIGTTSPTTQLDVREDQNALTSITVENHTNDTSAGARIIATDGTDGIFEYAFPSSATSTISEFTGTSGIYTSQTGGDLVIASRAASGNIRFYSGGDTSTKRAMTITAAGLVGIGSTSPVASLDLSQKTDAVALPVGTTGTRPATSINGMIRYNSTNGKFEAYQQNVWQDILTSAAGNGIALSNLTSAVAVNSMDNAAYAQTWTWNSLTTQNALTLSSSSETTGSLLNLSNTNASGTGAVLNVSTASTSNGYAMKGVASGASGADIGIYGAAASTGAGIAVYGEEYGAANSGYAVYAKNDGSGNTGYAVYGTNTSATGQNYGVYGVAASTGSGRGVQGVEGGAGNAGYGVVGQNTSTTGTNIGIYASAASTGTGTGLYATELGSNNTGYAIYGVNNSSTGWGEYQAGTAPNYFAGKVGIGTTAPGQLLEVNGASQFDGILTNTNGHIVLGVSNSVAGSVQFYAPDTVNTGIIRMNSGSVFQFNGPSGGTISLGISGGATETVNSTTVGIGTSTMSSSNKLEVNGSATIGYTNTAAPSNGLIVSGNIGIGTASPNTKLDIYGANNQLRLSSAANGVQSLYSYDGSTNIAAYYSRNDGAQNGLHIENRLSGGALYLGGNTSQTDLTITTGGSVGIGSTSPLASLDLSQKTDAVALPVGTTGTRPATSINGMMRYNSTNGKFEGYQQNAWQDILTSATGNTVFIGTALTAANPQIQGDATSGLYTPIGSTVAVITGGHEVMQWNNTANAVNYVSVTPGATGAAPALAAAGSDTNLSLNLTSKGTGTVNITSGYGITLNGANAISYPNGGADTSSLAIGPSALAAESANSHNLAVGSNTLQYATTSGWNVAVGFEALQGVSGTPLTSGGNTAVGSQALQSAQGAANGNTAVGQSAMANTTTGGNNTAVGDAAMIGVSGSGLTGISNTALGYEALYQIQTTAQYNTAVGALALQYSTTAQNNTAVGQGALKSVSGSGLTGSNNVAVGLSALAGVQTTAANNTAVGTYAANTLTTGTYNTALGFGAMFGVSGSELTGTYNVAIGVNAARQIETTANHNVAVGSNAMYYNTTGTLNTAIGDAAMYGVSGSELTGSANVAVGGNALHQIETTAGNDIAVGNQALYYNTTGSYNTAIGEAAMSGVSGSELTGWYNTAVGTYAMTQVTTTATQNAAFGEGALYWISSGSYNTAVGTAAMQGSSGNQLTGTYNTAVGNHAMGGAQTTAAYNTALGATSLNYNTTGQYNTALGYTAMMGVSGSELTGTFNTAVGSGALVNIETTAQSNTALGGYAMRFSTTASNNVAIGYGVMWSSNTNNLTGNNNVGVGYEALYRLQTTGANNTSLGANAGNQLTTGTNNTVLGYNVASATLNTGSNNILIGTGSSVDTPAAGTNNWLNIGNTIYGDLSAHGIAIGNGVTSVTAGAALDLSSDTSSLLFPIGTTGTRPGTAVNGMMRYNSTNGKFEAYQQNVWQDILTSASGNNVALSALTSAVATNSIDNVNYAQTWTWNSLTTQNALTLSSSSETTGSLLNLSNTNASGAGAVLSASTASATTAASAVSGQVTSASGNAYGVYGSTVSTGYGAGVYGTISGAANGGEGVFGSNTAADNSGSGVYGYNTSTGLAYGVYGAMGGSGNRGAAVYGNNNGSSNTGYGVEGANNSTSNGIGVFGTETGIGNSGTGVYGNNSGSSNSGAGVYGANSSTGTGFGVRGWANGASNTGYAGFFTNSGSGSSVNYGVYASTSSAGAAYGVFGLINGTGNTGYAGYFLNNGSSGTNYGVYGTTNSVGAGTGVYGSETGASNTGYAIYGLNNSSTGWGEYQAGSSPNYFAGSVGIGTTNPSNKLELQISNSALGLSAATVPFAVTNTNTTAGNVSGIAFRTLDSSGGNSMAAKIGAVITSHTASSVSADLAFGTMNGTFSENMRIASSGFVGIGSTSPVASLDLSQKTDAVALPVGTTGTRPATSINGMIRYNSTNGKFEAYQQNVWQDILTSASGNKVALSALTSATATNTIDNVNYAQTWTWNSLTTENALTLSSSSETTGSLLNLSNTNTSGTGTVLNVTTASAGGASAIEGVASAASGSGNGVYGSASSTGSGIGVYGAETGASNTGYAIYGLNNSSTGWGEYQAGSSPNYFAGKVGIGSTAPSNTLTVSNGSTSNAQLALINSSSGYGAGITFTPGNSSRASWQIGNEFLTGNTFQIIPNTGMGYTTAAMTITSAGAVGISTSAPKAPLDVRSGGNITVASFGADTTGLSIQGNWPSILFNATGNGTNNDQAMATGYGAQIALYESDGTLRFFTAPSVSAGSTFSFVDAMNITSTGQVGIGGTPSSVFEVNNMASTTPGQGITFGNSGTVWGGLRVSTAGTADLAFDTYNGSSWNSNVLVLSTTGLVGVGTTTPASSLDLSQKTDALALPSGTTGARPATGVNGMIRYNSSTNNLEAYANNSWSPLTTLAGGTPLSALTPATAANTIDNAAYAQTWTWNSLTTGTALTMSSSSMTSGHLLALTNTNASAGGAVLTVNSASTSMGTGISVTLSGTNNAGVAGMFSNTDSGSAADTALEGAAYSTGNGKGVYGVEMGAGNTGYGGYFNNFGGGAVSNFGVAGTTNATGAAYGVYGSETGAANTGYGVYGQNTATSGSNFGVAGTAASTGAGIGVYGSETGASNTGYAIYGLNNSSTGWGEYQAGSSPNYFAGSVGIGTTSPASQLEVFSPSASAAHSIITVQDGNSTKAAIFSGVNDSGNASFQQGMFGSSMAGTTFGVANANAAFFYTASALGGDYPSALLFGTYGGNAPVVFGTNNLERMRIDGSTGYIGIGSTSPVVSLDLSQKTDAVALPVGTTGTRPAASINGMIRYNSTNGKFEAYQQNVWQDILTSATGNNVALSALTSATAANSIDNAAYAQTWTWNSLTTQNALTLSSSSETTGALLALTDSNSAANGGPALNVSNASTGTSYGIKSIISGSTNTGYAVYGANTGGSGGTLSYGGKFTTNNGVGVAGTVSGSSNTGYGGYFNNASVTGTNYGAYATDQGNGTAYGIYGSASGGSNTGYGGYFTNASTGTAYGLYGSITGASNTGYAIYAANNSSTGWGVYSAGTSPNYFAGSVGIGTTAPAAPLEVFGGVRVRGPALSSAVYNATGMFMDFDSTNNVGRLITSNPSGNAMAFYVGASSNATEMMRITSTGSVGIGTTSPAASLDIVGAAATTGLRVKASHSGSEAAFDTLAAGQAFGVVWRDNGTNEWQLFKDSSQNFGLYDYTGTRNVLIAYPNGNMQLMPAGGQVGIGGAPSVSLDVSHETDALALPSGTTGARPTGPNGMIRYNSTTPGLEAYVNNAWTAIQTGGGSGVALSSLTSATATNTIDNVAYAQTWTWNSLTTGTALTLSSSSATSGKVLSVGISTASNTGYAGYFTNTGGGAVNSYGVYGSTTATGTNAAGVYGYGGTSGVYGSGSTYGVYGTTSSGTAGVYGTTAWTSGGGVYGLQPSTSNAFGYGVKGENSGSNNAGYGVYALNDGTSNTGYGLYANNSSTNSTTTSAAVYATETGSGNKGYAGYFVNNGGGSTQNYGVYAETNSTASSYALYAKQSGTNNTGAAGWFDNSTGAWGLYVSASKNYFSGYIDSNRIGIGSTSPRASIDMSQQTDALILPSGTTGARPATGVNGMIRYNSTTPGLEAYVNNAWAAISTGGGGVALSALTSATATNTIDNVAYAQTWTWNSLTTGSGLTLSSNSMTTGSILTITNSNTVSSTGPVLNVTDAGTGGIAIKGVSSAGTGYAYGVYGSSASGLGAGVYGISSANGASGVYGVGTSTSGYSGYGVTGTTSSTTSGSAGVAATATGTSGNTYGLYATNVSTASNAAAVYGSETASTGTTYGGYFLNSSSGGTGVYGEMTGTSNSGAAVYGYESGTSNSGIAGKFINAGGGSTANYGVYGMTNSTGAAAAVAGYQQGTSNTGYAFYASNSSTTGWGIYSSAARNYFSGNIGIGSTSPAVSLDLSKETDALALPSGTTGTRPATGVNGMIRYNSTTPGLEAYVNNAWAAIQTGAGGGVALSALTSATATNTIDNAAYAQTWTWNSLTTQNALTLSSSSETTGSLLSLAGNNTGVSGNVLSVSTTSTGGATGISVSLSGTGGASSNTGISSGVSSTTDYTRAIMGSASGSSGRTYGVEGTSSSTGIATGVYGYVYGAGNSGYGVLGQDSSSTGAGHGVYGEVSSTQTGYGVYGIELGSSNTGYGGYFTNFGSSGTNYGVYGAAESTGTGTGVYGQETGSNNTGYAGLFTNNSGAANSYGVYSSASGTAIYGATSSTGSGAAIYGWITGASNTGYAIYGLNSSTTGWGEYQAGTSPNYFAGNVGIGTAAPAGKLQVATGSDTGNGNPAAFSSNFFTVGAGGTNGGNVFISYNQSSNTGFIGALVPGTAWGSLILQPQGSVAIGTPTPSSTAQTTMYDTINANLPSAFADLSTPVALQITNSASTVSYPNNYTGIEFDTGNSNHAYGAILVGQGKGMNFYSSENTTSTAPALTILSNGLIGIGSSSPVASLDLSQKTDALALPSGTTGTRPATGVNGMIRYNSTTPGLEAYVNNAWAAISTGGGGGGAALSALTSATATNTIDNANYAQTWTWNTLTTENALLLSSSSITSGSLLTLTGSNATESGYVLSVSTSSTSGGRAISAVASAATGVNYGVSAIAASASGYAVYGTNSTTAGTASIGAGSAIFGSETGGGNTAAALFGGNSGASNTGYAVYGANTGGGAVTNYGVYGTTNSTGTGTGVYGAETGASNTGYGGYFTNTGGGAVANYGVYATTNSIGAGTGVYGSETGASNTGYAIYGLNNSTTGWGEYQAGSAPNYFKGSIGIGSTSPTGLLTIYEPSTNTASNVYGLYLTGAQSTANTGIYYGLYVAPNYSSSNSMNTMIGSYLAPSSSWTGTMTALYGELAAPANAHSGTVTSMAGVYANPNDSSSAITTSMYGVESVPTHSSSGTVTSMYGVYSKCSDTASGYVTTCYELYLDTPNISGSGTITNQYGIYEAGSGLTNYFAGNVGIGTTAPAASLDAWNSVANGAAGHFEQTNTTNSNGVLVYTSTSNAGDTALGLNANSNWIFTVRNNGKIGIGTSTPTVSLDISQQTDALALPSGTTGQRPATGVNGMIRYNSTTPGLEAYVNNAWTAVSTGGGSGASLSGLTSATATNTIDNVNYAQTWTWNTLTTQNALTLSSSSETSGSLLTLTNSNTTGAGIALNVSTATTGGGYAIKGAASGTSGTNYGVYGTAASSAGVGVYGANTSTSGNNWGIYGTTATTGVGTGVYGEETGAGNTGYGVFASNSGSGNAGYGLFAQNNSTASGAVAAYGQATGASGATYGIYGTASSTGTGTGIYGSETGASNTGYAVYANNSSASGWGVYSAGTSPNYFGGNVGIGTQSPGAKLDTYGTLRSSIASGTDALQVYNTSVSKFWELYPITNGTGTDLRLYEQTTVGGTGSDRVTFQAGGNVGIGTPSPASDALLDMYKSAAGTDIRARVYNGGTGSGTQARYDLSTGSANAYSVLAANDGTTPYTELSTGSGETGGLYMTTGTTAPIIFRTNGSEAMRIGSSGNVGIGNTNPGTLLQVGGTVATNRYATIDSSGNGTFRYDNNGLNVPLTVENLGLTATGQGTGMYFDLNTGGGTAIPSGAILMTNTDTYAATANQTADMVFDTISAGSLNESMRITGGGLVGIGTSAPDNPLVVKAGGFYGLEIYRPTTPNHSYVFISPGVGGSGYFNNLTQAGDAAIIYTNSSGQNNGNLVIGPWSNTGYAGIRMDSNGYVSIGTSKPLNATNVYGTQATITNQWGNSETTGPLVVENSTNDNDTTSSQTVATFMRDEKYGVSYGVVANWNLGRYSYSGTASQSLMTLRMANGNTENPDTDVMTWTAQGRVGIGNTAPSYVLDVTGQARFTGGYTTSDRRWKKDIVPLKDALDTIDRLQGVNFHWRRKEFPYMNFAKGKQIGFIAQEVEKVLPEIVSTDDKGYKSVNYQAVIPVLTEAVKTLKKENDDLRRQVAALEQKKLSSSGSFAVEAPNSAAPVPGKWVPSARLFYIIGVGFAFIIFLMGGIVWYFSREIRKLRNQ